MKVGDYVRTKDGIILKIKDVEDIYTTDNIYIGMAIYDNEGHFVNDVEIIKSSPNIIDLIEVGDILVIKDFVDEACMIFTDIYLIQNEQQLLNIKNDLEKNKNKNKKLYSIVTKEQFSNCEYRIKE